MADDRVELDDDGIEAGDAMSAWRSTAMPPPLLTTLEEAGNVVRASCQVSQGRAESGQGSPADDTAGSAWSATDDVGGGGGTATM